MSRIYLSQREGDAPEWAGRVAEHLRVCFGEDTLAPPAPAEGVRGTVAACDGLLVLVGPAWEKGGEPGSPGLADPKDRVRLEIETALEKGLLVVPVLLAGAALPAPDTLPQSLVPLGRCPAHPISPHQPREDLARLTHRLETALALRAIVRESAFKRGSIHQRPLPEEDLLGFTDESRPPDILGLSRSTLGETRRAIDFQQTALNLARRTRDRAAECRALGKLGLAYGKLGETQRAIECFEQQLPMVRELGSPAELGALLANLGDAWAVRGQFSRAISCYQEQLGLALQQEDRNLEAASQVGLGHCYIKLGEIQRGVACYERALKHLRQEGTPAEQARLLVGLGLNYRKLERTRDALGVLKEALELARGLGDRHEEACLLGDLAECYQALEEADLARGYREQQLEVARELGDARTEADILMHLALHHWAADNRSRALELARAASECVQNVDACAHRRIEDQIAEWDPAG